MQRPNIEQFIRLLPTSEFVLQAGLPLGYTPGLPIFTVRNGDPLLIVPMVRYRITGQVDKTLVYPPRFLVTVQLRDLNFVGYTDLSYDQRFQRVDFNAPVGYFRHKAIRHMDREGYNNLRSALYGLLDVMTAAYINNEKVDPLELQRFRQIYATLIEPSLRPFYQAIDKDFYNSYL